MKKFLKLSLIIFLLNGCGYTSVFKSSEKNVLKINYEIVKLDGDENINNYISNNLGQYLNRNIEEITEISINSKYTKSGIVNNRKGETTSYILSAEVEFITKKNQKNKNILLREKIKINKLKDNFSQRNYENKIIKEISKLITEKFINELLLIK